ncbi:MAG: InlB B-repeat-containing protein [Bacilli bacterium]
MKKNIVGLLSILLMVVVLLPKSAVNASGVKNGIGNTIFEQFPDPNMASAVADVIANGDVNAVIDQELVDNTQDLILRDSSITDITGISVFSELDILDLSNNDLKTLPESVGELKELQLLTLFNNNSLATLPESIGELTELKTLKIMGGDLVSVPESIGNLSELEDLQLAKNNLVSIPESIGELKKLKNLQLYDNNLTSLPSSILELPQLFNLTICGNLLPESAGAQIEEQQNDLNVNQSFNKKLMISNSSVKVEVGSKSDFETIDYASILKIEEQKKQNETIEDYSKALNNYEYTLESITDEDGNIVEIDSYFDTSGSVIKEGTVFAKVRANGTGLFENSSENAITTDKVKMQFSKQVNKYNLFLNVIYDDINYTHAFPLVAGELIKKPNDVKRDGYKFIGWNTSVDGSGVIWDFDSDLMPANDLNLYAQWEKVDSNIETLPKTGLGINSSMILMFGATVLLRKMVKKNNK